MKALTTTLVAALLVLSTTAAAAEQPDIKKFDPGSYVTGPKFTGKHLRGKVIVVEYWGITCPPCLKAIPHTTELAKEYGFDQVAIIANQVWKASDRQCKTTWEKHAKNNMVMVTNGGEMPGFKPKGVPAAVIFDHNLKPVWQGHPGAMDKALEKAVKALPANNAPAKDTADQPADQPAE